MADKYITDENGVTFNESGELVADIVQQPTIEVDPETANMENLAISNHAKYLTTYNTPKDWVLDEKEARLAQIQQNAWTPEQASRVGSLKYGVKQFLIDTYDTPQELGAAISLGAAKVEDAFYPNADKKAIERWYENYGKLNVESDKIVDEYMSSHAGKHPYWLMGGSVALGLARDMAIAGGFAKLGASVAAKKATAKVAERYVGEDVAARYVGMAAQTGAEKAGQKAIVGSVFAQEFGSSTMGDVAEYIQKTGDSELKYYDPTVDLATNLGVSLLSSQIEKGLGVERYVPRLVASAVRRGEKVPALAQVITRGVEGGIGEMSEEALQEGLSQFGDMIKGYKDWWDFDTDKIITGAVLGAIGGTGASAGLHYINRRIAINRLKAEGLDENTAADLVDTIISDETNKTLNNLSAVNELKTQNGQAYEKLKTAMKRALETQGWKDKIIKDGVPMDIDEYVSLNAKDFIKPAIYYSNKYNLPIDLFLDIAEFTGFNNVLVMRDLGTAEQIKAKIDAQTNIIKTQQELKKTGAGDSGVLNRAKINKAILQKAYVNATLSQEIQKVNLEEAQTPETKQEISTANEDADVLGKKETVEDFNAEMNNKTQNGVPLTADQKNKRFGNAVIKRIFGKDKLGFETVMTLPEYANARQGILNSAMRIFDFVKKHRTYGLYTDLRNALNQMQTVNQTNFIESVTTPSLDGRDVIAQNAFLYHFLFSDSNTITAFIDAYLQRAEASINGETKTDLSKKDLVGQSFETVDKMLQIKAEASGTQYVSIYNEDSSIKDENVAAVMMSYQNQFAVQPEGQVLEQFDEIDGMITTNSLYSVRNVLQGLKDDSTERMLYDKSNKNWYLADADTITHIDMFIKAFEQGNTDFTSKREAEQYFNENYLAEEQILLSFLVRKLKTNADAKQSMEHILGTDEYTDAYLSDNLVIFARNEYDLADSGFATQNYDHYKVKYDNNNKKTIVLKNKAQTVEENVSLLDRAINPRWAIPKVRGGWTKEKILRYLKSVDSYSGVGKATREIANFDTVEDFKNHVFYHGSRYGTSGGMQPSITMSDKKVERIGGGGYGEKYWAISLTKSKRVAGNIATAMGGGNIYPVLLAKNAKVIEMPELTDSIDLEDHIVDLYEKGVDAVWIGDKNAGEQELAVINPKAIINLGKSEFYNAYGFGTEKNPIRMNTEEDFRKIFEFAKEYRNKDKETRLDEAKKLVYWQSANGFFDPELNVIVLGKNFNTMTLPHEMAHYWLETLFNVYKRMQVGQLTSNAGFMQEVKSMFDMLGINDTQETITRGQHEKFARMTEAYLTGIGVSPEMNQTYKAYLKWIPEKYKSLQQLAYLDDEGRIKLPFLDQKAVDFFNRWYENPVLPSLSTSPERQRFMNVTGTNGDVITVSIKEMNDREKEFAQDAEEQIHADERLYNTLKENMPGNIKATADAQKVVINERSNFLKEAQTKQKEIKEEPERRWYERKSRETEIQKAKEYLANNLDHAKDVIYGDPEFIPNDTGVDRATLINTYMALNNITPQHSDWAILHTNIAINQSLAGTQLALSNNQSYGPYLDALREVENVLELKAATNYAGSKNGAKERFNIDIRRFLDQELPAIFATEPNSKEREQALHMLFEKARTTFSGNTTGGVLNQMDLDYAKSQKRKTEAFVNWAMNQIKKDAGAKLSNEKMAKLLEISAKAQQALIDLDNPDSAKAVAAALDIIKWQVEKNKLMGVSPKKFSFFGDWMPRAMLASFNTLLVTNPPSTFMNTWIVRALRSDIFGKNKVSDSLIEKEIKRIKAIYNATGMNLAQMEKPTSPSLLHGEKYSTSGQKWYDPYTILGREDNFFRVPTFVNTLARIASTDAKATGRNADEVFQEYLSLSNQTDEAKLARKQALAVANMAVFTQNGGLAKCLNHIRSELNKLSRTAIGLDPQGFGLGNLLSPFLTTGANIAEMGIRGSLAPVTTIATMVNKWRTGKALDPMKKLALRMDWAYFTFSALSVALLAALTSDDDEFYTDPYVTGRKYDPNKPYDSINLGGVWLDLDFFGPFSIPMRTAAKAIQEWKKDNGILAGYGESAKTVLGDIPLAETIINNQISWATKKPGDWATSYVYNQANKAIPAIVKPVFRAASRGAGVQFDAQDWIGQIAGRKFHRNYGFDGAELTTQDLIDILTIKVQLDESLNQELK